MDDEAVERAMRYAHDTGYDEGYECGYEDGYDVGYEDGVAYGYEKGIGECVGDVVVNEKD